MFAHKVVEQLLEIGSRSEYMASLPKSLHEAMQNRMIAEGLLTNNFDYIEYGKCALMSAAYIAQGQRFYCDTLPPEVEIKDVSVEELKLPFPVTCLFFKDELVTGQNTGFLCKEVEKVSPIRDAVRDSYPDFVPMFTVTVVYKDKTGYYEIGNMMYIFGELNGEVKCEVREHKFCDGMLLREGADYQVKANALANELMGVLLGFLQMLHCSNVVHENVKPDEKLQKKRKKSGKLPMYEYKVLKIRHSNGSTSSMAGDGASPRFHYRRGYFGHRWKGSGDSKKLERVWISPCAVGNKESGEIQKEYRFN